MLGISLIEISMLILAVLVVLNILLTCLVLLLLLNRDDCVSQNSQKKKSNVAYHKSAKSSRSNYSHLHGFEELQGPHSLKIFAPLT